MRPGSNFLWNVFALRKCKNIAQFLGKKLKNYLLKIVFQSRPGMSNVRPANGLDAARKMILSYHERI